MASSSINSVSHTARILLVDDNSNGLLARKSVLEELGYQISTASNVESALEIFRSGPFDLVITDYRMPGMSGVDLIEKVRAQAPAISIILVSGFVDTLGLNEKSTGADVVIQKSANEVAHLVRSVSRLLRPRKPAGRQRTTVRTKRRAV